MRALTIFGAILFCCGCRTELLAPQAGLAGAAADLGSAPDAACGPPACPAPLTGCAAHTDETACVADIACKAILLCGEKSFQGCADLDAPLPQLGPFCILTRCGTHMDDASCAADTDCHSTFVQTTTLDCSTEHPDCNLGFDHCAIGAPICAPASAQPCIGNPTANCAGAYVPEYDSSGCISDCVRSSLCASGD